MRIYEMYLCITSNLSSNHALESSLIYLEIRIKIKSYSHIKLVSILRRIQIELF